MFDPILIPTDLSNISEKSFATAIEMARKFGGKLFVMHVLPDYGYSIVSQYFPADAQEKAREEAVTKLKEYIAQHGVSDLVADIRVVNGSIYGEILKTAEEIGAKLIVISGRDRSPLDRFLMGSNAEKVVRYAHCTVQMVK